MCTDYNSVGILGSPLPFSPLLATAMQQILLIEDEPLIRESLEDVLSLEGFSLITARDGKAGLQAIHQRRPDLVICDINMPEMDGYKVLDALRQEPTTQNIPFIFLTARSSRTDQRHGMELGADDYLTKPFTVEELMNAVRTRLQRHEKIEEKFTSEVCRNQALQQQVRSKEELATLKARLLDKVIEEFRTPLANVNMALSMLERVRTDEERDRYLGILRQEYSRQAALIAEVANLQEMTTPRNGQQVPRLNLTSTKLF